MIKPNLRSRSKDQATLVGFFFKTSSLWTIEIKAGCPTAQFTPFLMKFCLFIQLFQNICCVFLLWLVMLLFLMKFCLFIQLFHSICRVFLLSLIQGSLKEYNKMYCYSVVKFIYRTLILFDGWNISLQNDHEHINLSNFPYVNMFKVWHLRLKQPPSRGKKKLNATWFLSSQ